MTETWEQMQVVFRDVFDDDAIELRPGLTAADIETWDSLTHMNLIVAIERAFKIKFTTAEVSRMENVGEFAALVDRKREAKS